MYAVIRLISCSHLMAGRAVKRHLDTLLIEMVLHDLKTGELGFLATLKKAEVFLALFLVSFRLEV